MEPNGEQTSRGLSGRLALLRLPPRASAFGLSPGLGSPDPLGRFARGSYPVPGVPPARLSRAWWTPVPGSSIWLEAGGTPAVPGGGRGPPYSPVYRFRMIDALVPPKPKELLAAYSRSTLRAVWGTKSRSHPSPGSSRLMVGGRVCSRTARARMPVSRPPAAPSRWPVEDLVEETASL